jgi:hypothetical protein
MHKPLEVPLIVIALLGLAHLEADPAGHTFKDFRRHLSSSEGRCSRYTLMMIILLLHSSLCRVVRV